MIGKGTSVRQWGLLVIGSILSILSGCSGCSSDSDSAPSDTSVRISGVVLDPYIVNARVWCDLNTNAVYDDGTDPSVLTDNLGKYEFAENICVDKTIIVDGMDGTTHVDANGNVISKFTGRMKAASGSGFVTPLTSLHQTLVESGKTADEARRKVAKALGLVDTTGVVLDIDFSQLDISSSDQKKAQKAAIVAQQLLLDTTAAMQGVSGAPMTPSSFEVMTNSLADTIANAQHPLIKENGGLDPVAVRQMLQSTVEEAVKKEQRYMGFDAANIVQAIGDAVVVNSQQAATVVDESIGGITAEKLMQSQGSGSEMIRVTMDTIKTYMNGSGDFDGDGSADIGQGVANAGDLIEELKNVLLAVSSGLAEAVSTETKDVVTSSTVSTAEVKSVIANVVQNTVGLALNNMNLKHVAARVIKRVDSAIDNGSIEGLGDVTKNKAPKAMNGTLAVRSGQSKSARLFAKELNEQDTLTFSIATDSTGKVTINDDGSYIFNASELTSGSYSFTFNVSDRVATDTGTIKIAVLGTNLNPVVQDLAVMLRQGDSLSGSFSAIDFDGDDLSYQFINPKNMFSLAGDIYTINSEGVAAGFYTANYRVADASGGESYGEIVVEVMSLDKNNPPIAFNGSLQLQQGAKGTGKFRAADPDLTDTLTFSILSSNSSLFELNATTGEYTFNAAEQAVGVYIATFQVSDGTETDTATLTIAVKSENNNSAPVARDSFIELVSGTTKDDGMLLATDFDEGDSLSYALLTVSEQGAVTVNSDGIFSFNASSVGAGIYEFTFKVTDSHGASATGKVTVVIMATNLPPKALDGWIKADRSTSTSLSAILVALDDGKTSALAYTITSNDGGRAVLTDTGTSDGSFTFNVTDAALGLHEIAFTVFDGERYGDGIFTIMVGDSSLSNLPPQAVDSSMTVEKGTIGNGNFVAVDDGAGGSLKFIITDSEGKRAALTDTGELDGSFTFNANNTDPGIYAVKFSVFDEQEGLPSNGMVTVTVVAPIGINNPPITKNSELTLSPEEIVESHFVARDRDGDALTFSIVASAGLNVSLIDGKTGSYKIDTRDGSKGRFTITFSVSDGELDNIGSVAVLIRNSAPIANDASFEVNNGDTLSGTLTAKDINGADTLIFTKLTDPAQGSVTVNENGSFTFDATTAEAGVYSFDFKASDDTASDTGKVTLTVLAVTPGNNPPVVSDGSLTVTSGESANGTLSGEDKDGDTLAYSVVAQSSQGAATVNSNGTYTFNATSATAGSYTFTFKANDGKTDSNTATITVTVKAPSPVNNAPIAQNGILPVLAGAVGSDSLQANDTDGDNLSFTKLTDPSSGVVTVAENGSYTFDASTAADGVYTFTFQVSDGKATSDGTVTVTVGSFLRASQVMLNQTEYTVAGFQSSGAAVNLPLTAFGFNLQAMGQPGTDMSVELGLSMLLDGSNKKIHVIVNNINLSVLNNGALQAKVSSSSQATVSYNDGTTTTEVTMQNTAEDMVSTSAAGAATTLSINIATLFDRVREKVGNTGGWPFLDTGVKGIFSSTGVVKVTNQNSQQVNVKDDTDTNLNHLTVTTSGGASVSGPGITGNLTLQ